jgi:hypothetical protein
VAGISGNEQSKSREAIGSPRLRAPAIIVDLCDAAALIGMHGDHTRLSVVAEETAVKCADRNPLVIARATKTLENAPRRERMLD